MNKKLLALVGAAALLSVSSLQASEKKSSAGGLEFSGNIDVVAGGQHDSANAVPGVSSKNDIDTAGEGQGQLGDFRGAAGPKRDTINFYIDQVELDVNRTFGENIRIRADLDFGRALSGSGRTTAGTNFDLEQGYVTANIPVGNGLEFLIGRFNAPIGLESVDRNENVALSFTNLYRFLRPHNVTGAKIYYAFSDMFDWHVYAVNNLYDVVNSTLTGTTDTPVPSFGSRFGFTWGDKGKENVIGLSYAGGPESAVSGTNAEKHFTHIGDLDFSFHVTDSFIIAGEGIYRQDNLGGAKGASACVPTASNAGKNCKGLGGDLLLAYNMNETWGMYFRYDYMNDFQGNYTGVDQQIHDFSLGATYQITDGAKMTMEYRLDLDLPSSTQPAATAYLAGKKGWNNGFALEFAYNF